MNRRAFLRTFAVGSVGMVAADKLGFWGELWQWATGPQKTIFIPPPLYRLTCAQIASLELEKIHHLIPVLYQNDDTLYDFLHPVTMERRGSIFVPKRSEVVSSRTLRVPLVVSPQ